MSKSEQANPLPLFRFDRTPEGWRLSLSVQLRDQNSGDDSVESLFRRGVSALGDVADAMRTSINQVISEQQGGEL